MKLQDLVLLDQAQSNSPERGIVISYPIMNTHVAYTSTFPLKSGQEKRRERRVKERKEAQMVKR